MIEEPSKTYDPAFVERFLYSATSPYIDPWKMLRNGASLKEIPDKELEELERRTKVTSSSYQILLHELIRRISQPV